MPLNWVYRIGGSGTLLTPSEVDNNIRCIYGALSSYGWSLKAICGAIGCFYEESGMNPGIYETSHGGNLNYLPYFPGGMGLAQWTDYPAYEAQYPNPLPWSADREGQNWYDGNFQCWLLTQAANNAYTSMGYGEGPRWGWQTSNKYPSIAFNTYIRATQFSIREMVEFWFFDLEWHSSGIPDWVNFNARVRWGEYAYQLLSGETPEQPGGTLPVNGSLSGFINWCINKCNEPDVGYSNQYRNQQTVNGITYYDCSSFVWYGLVEGGLFDLESVQAADPAWQQSGFPDNYPFFTQYMDAILSALGWVEVDRNGELKQGDIGVTPGDAYGVGGHTEVVFQGGNGEAVFMGAHNDTYPLDKQVSISDFVSPGNRFEKIWRYPYDTPVTPPSGSFPTGKMPLWMMLGRKYFI